MLNSKIHRATVTEADVNCTGSISIDKSLIKKVDILPGEKVLVVNLTNGQRFETYVQEEKSGTGNIIMNGGTARLCSVGDKVTIMSFCMSEGKIEPKKILVDEKNKFYKSL